MMAVKCIICPLGLENSEVKRHNTSLSADNIRNIISSDYPGREHYLCFGVCFRSQHSQSQDEHARIVNG